MTQCRRRRGPRGPGASGQGRAAAAWCCVVPHGLGGHAAHITSLDINLRTWVFEVHTKTYIYTLAAKDPEQQDCSDLESGDLKCGGLQSWRQELDVYSMGVCRGRTIRFESGVTITMKNKYEEPFDCTSCAGSFESKHTQKKKRQQTSTSDQVFASSHIDQTVLRYVVTPWLQLKTSLFWIQAHRKIHEMVSDWSCVLMGWKRHEKCKAKKAWKIFENLKNIRADVNKQALYACT